MVTETLTDDGIKSDDAMVTRAEYVEHHGEPVAETDNRVVFRDEHNFELTDWADALGVEYDHLHKKMHELARDVYDGEGAGDPWSVADPVVFDAKTFK